MDIVERIKRQAVIDELTALASQARGLVAIEPQAFANMLERKITELRGGPSAEFIDELVVLCAKHNATLFARTDGKSQILSLQLGRFWIDYVRIDGTGAQRLHES